MSDKDTEANLAHLLRPGVQALWNQAIDKAVREMVDVTVETVIKSIHERLKIELEAKPGMIKVVLEDRREK